MPIHTREGYVFYEDQHYLKKVGTREFFTYSPELAQREDMVLYNPWHHDHRTIIVKAPGVDEVEHHRNRTKELTGMTREEIREVILKFNRTQRLLWSIDLLFKRSKLDSVEQFVPFKNDLIRIMGPGFTNEELNAAFDKYKSNPQSINYFIAKAATKVIDSESDNQEIISPSPTEVQNDLTPTSNIGSEQAG